MAKHFKPIFANTNRITTGLTSIERARGFLEAVTLSDAWVREMDRRALILEAHHTTHIEGTRLTLDQAEQLLEGKPVPDADPDDVRELLNYKKAFEFVSEYFEDNGSGTVTGRGGLYRICLKQNALILAVQGIGRPVEILIKSGYCPALPAPSCRSPEY